VDLETANKELSAFILYIYALGGLLAFPTYPPYRWFTLLFVGFSYLAYRRMRVDESRRIFVRLACANLLVGISLGLLCYEPVPGQLSNLGVVILLLMFVPNGIVTLSLYKLEVGRGPEKAEGEQGQ
jgi:hypothetical protein